MNVKCDVCEGKSNRGKPFQYQMFDLKLPLYNMFYIEMIDVDICAKCYADIFNKPEIQNIVKRIREERKIK